MADFQKSLQQKDSEPESLRAKVSPLSINLLFIMCEYQYDIMLLYREVYRFLGPGLALLLNQHIRYS